MGSDNNRRSLLALIVRFVVSEDHKESTTDEEFVQRQLATLKPMSTGILLREKQPRAMQWIRSTRKATGVSGKKVLPTRREAL